MAANIILMLCSLLLACDAIHGWDNSYLLAPPIGNSLVLKSKTQNGMQIYKCSSGKWVAVGATADLVQASNPTVRVGAYYSALLQDQSTASATWILNNPAGETAESGYNISSVSGKEIATAPPGGFISEALLQSTDHQFAGVASLISYIQRLFPQGGDPPQQTCMQESAIVQVPFEVEFWLWKQDMMPPATPPALSLSKERVVQGFFGEGSVLYRYNGSSWQQTQAQATLYNVPGGTTMGKYSLQAATVNGRGGSSYLWQTSIPNGFQVTGKEQSQPVSVDQNCLSWSLVVVTSYSSNDFYLGPYTHVQIVSTRGGLPPSHPNFMPLTGTLITSPFSAIFWFYTNS
ncbi:hypothetical protein O6H91_Y545600 [Diphasiastrum complanatum]|nr:hypothetical protein O6H91_Y545600 [Diphasiastrum complanatum]